MNLEPMSEFWFLWFLCKIWFHVKLWNFHTVCDNVVDYVEASIDTIVAKAAADIQHDDDFLSWGFSVCTCPRNFLAQGC